MPFATGDGDGIPPNVLKRMREEGGDGSDDISQFIAGDDVPSVLQNKLMKAHKGKINGGAENTPDYLKQLEEITSIQEDIGSPGIINVEEEPQEETVRKDKEYDLQDGSRIALSTSIGDFYIYPDGIIQEEMFVVVFKKLDKRKKSGANIEFVPNPGVRFALVYQGHTGEVFRDDVYYSGINFERENVQYIIFHRN